MLETTLTHNMDCRPQSRFQLLKSELAVEATEHLSHVVESLNKRLSEWCDDYGAKPDLRWRYGVDELKELSVYDAPDNKEACERLFKIVATFNKRFKDWRDEMACTANFMWLSESGASSKLVITEIDMMVYRKPAPSEESIKNAIEKIASQKVSADDF